MMVKQFILIAFFLLNQTNIYSQIEKYQKVRIYFEDKNQYQELVKKGLFIDHFIQNEFNSIDVEISSVNLDILIKNNVEFIVLKEDLPGKSDLAHPIDLKSGSSDKICGLKNFSYGTMGHFHSYKEILIQLDSMKSKFPNLITSKAGIGTTIEGRTIYAVKISDNPDMDESNTEASVYFDALHHAREPMSMESLLFYMWWLLENYATDSEAYNLVNNRELYFIPIVNPDGYVYNEKNMLNGYGYWRKNRRDCGNGVFGVDLNRNYSKGFGDTIGSGSIASSEVYHGENAFSEPETQAVRDYLIKVKPKTAFTCHSFGQAILCSPGCTSTPHDSKRYSEFSSEFINKSFIGYGSDLDMVSYNACGTASDYMDDLGIYAWTIEIGSAFWPDISEFCPTVFNMSEPMKYISHIAGSYTRLNDFSVLNPDGVIANDTMIVHLRVKNRGLGLKAKNVTVTATSESDNCKNVKSSAFFGNIDPEAFAEDKFMFLLTSNAKPLDTVSIRITIMENDFITYTGIKKVILGKTDKIFYDDSESELISWDTDKWDVTSKDMQSGIFSITDSKNGSYNSRDTTYLVLNSSINLTGTTHPIALFNAKWSFAPYDGVSLLVSTDNISWDTLTNYTSHQHWTQQFIDLSNYRNKFIKLKFQLHSDIFVQSDGFYLDDFKIVDIDTVMNIFASEQLNMNDITIFPNPTSGLINIVKRNNSKALVEIFDCTGKLVFSSFFENYYFSVDLSNMSSGLYFIRYGDKDIMSTFKVIHK